MDPWDDVSPPDDSFSLMQNQGSSFCKAFREREEFYFKHKSDENSNGTTIENSTKRYFG